MIRIVFKYLKVMYPELILRKKRNRVFFIIKIENLISMSHNIRIKKLIQSQFQNLIIPLISQKPSIIQLLNNPPQLLKRNTLLITIPSQKPRNLIKTAPQLIHRKPIRIRKPKAPKLFPRLQNAMKKTQTKVKSLKLIVPKMQIL